MAVPTLTVEMGFGFGPYTDPASITWTNVTTYVKSNIRISRGRSTELDQFSPGTCSFTLDNHLRRFDPEYASSPYAGNLVPNVPVRVSLTISSTTYRRFYGFVSGWPQSYDHPADATVAITAFDAFKLLARRALPESVYAYEVAKDAPKVWLRLADGNGTTAADSSGNGFDGRWNRVDDDHTAPSIIDGSTVDASEFDGALRGDFIDITNSAAMVTAAPLVVELWVKMDNDIAVTLPASFTTQLVSSFGPAAGARFEMFAGQFAGAADRVSVDIEGTQYNTITDATGVFTTGTVLDGLLHHVVFYDPGTPQIVIDGVSRHLYSAATSTPSAPQTHIQVGGSNHFINYSWPGWMANVATYDTDIGLARIQAHYAAGVKPWNNDNSGTRLGRILDVIGWPAAQRNIDTGETILGVAELASQKTLDYAQKLELTEQGRLFIAGDGKVTFHARNHDLITATGTTSQATFTDTGSNLQIEPGLNFTKDDRYQYRIVTAQRDGGEQVTVSDSTLTALDDVQTKNISGLMCRTDEEVRNIAESFLFRYKTATTRADGWACRPLQDTTKWSALLGLDLGYRVTVARTPQSIGTAISKSLMLEQIVEDIPAGPMADYTISFTGSPADDTSYFVWGTSTWGGADVWR